MDKKTSLKETISKLQNELWNIEEVERESKSRLFVGKYFKYHNSYSSDEKWWLYVAITGLTSSWPSGWSFQKDCYGKIEVQTGDHFAVENVGYIKISKSEFNKAWKKLLKEVNGINV